MISSVPGFRLRCKESEFHDPLATGTRDVITRLYVAGPMTGYDECNYPLFNQTAESLRAYGYEVENPAEATIKAAHYVDFLRADLQALLTCHGVALLDGWEHSTGARNEAMVAGVLRMPVKPVLYWLDRAVMEGRAPKRPADSPLPWG